MNSLFLDGGGGCRAVGSHPLGSFPNGQTEPQPIKKTEMARIPAEILFSDPAPDPAGGLDEIWYQCSIRGGTLSIAFGAAGDGFVESGWKHKDGARFLGKLQ